MAAISGVTALYQTIDFGSNNWQSVTLPNNTNDFYLIGIKSTTPASTDTIDISKVANIVLEIGIETGVTNKYITVARPVLNFNELTSSDEALNKITAFIRMLNIPSTFYIKLLSISTVDKQYTAGKCSISININPVTLGSN